ncbi:T9SS type A sorting domain-containing protein [Mangrovimonas xylaniphaga]|uniref:T9SS type A sorting domain-containing protein n=1 Tax=Mangrovimonas xylaniphaga TaxID=1645915 RepID=UPI0006B62C20|nr:T9SS type A sorting domain-containing protein [Mangrovimonas xylaniphaga]
MKLKLPNYFLGAFLGASFFANAQNYEPLLVSSGFTEDIIANGPGSSLYSTTEDADGAYYAFMSNDFNPDGATTLTNALPTDGLFTSITTNGLIFQLADYSSNNSLRLVGENASGTVTFSNSIQATTLFVVGTSGSGDSDFTTTVTFSDNSTQTFDAVTMPDWYYKTTQPRALQGFGRVNKNTDEYTTGGTNPRLYQIKLELSPENYGKQIQSITITKSESGGVLNIMAFSAELAPSCLPIYNLEASTGPSSAEVTWSLPTIVPSNGFDYYLSTESTAPDATTEPTGNLSASTTSLSFPELATGTTNYLWIRSNCGGYDLGDWLLVKFTPGQASATYTQGDINTHMTYSYYITPTSTTTCPGLLTVTVPEGYQVSNVGVSYSMTSQNYAYRSEARSLLVCNTTGNQETELFKGTGTMGTHNYNRDNLTIANGATGTVEFELRAWRTYGGAPDSCNDTYIKVDNNTWTVTVTYEPTALSTPSYKLEELSIYPNPANNVVTVKAGEEISDITVFNLLGQVVLNKNGNGLTEELNISSLAKGNYILKTTTTTGKQGTTKLIKQ